MATIRQSRRWRTSMTSWSPRRCSDPAGGATAFAAWTKDLPAGAPVLDCACGPGHLAVGLALAGHAVTATDASPAMVTRTRALATAAAVALDAEAMTWDELASRVGPTTFWQLCCTRRRMRLPIGRGSKTRAVRAAPQPALQAAGRGTRP